MTLEEVVKRLTALEEAFEQMRHERQADRSSDADNGNDEPGEANFIPGVEYDLVPDVPPKQVIRLKGKIVSVKPGPKGLALSDAEWQSLHLEEDDE
jgi:hypothetical protein